MSTRGIYKARTALTLMDRVKIDQELLIERIAREQEQAMFDSIKNEPRLLAELKAEHDAYITKIEKQIADGVRLDWKELERKLHEFAERRRLIVDPLGIGELVKAKPRAPTSVYERYLYYDFKRWW